MNTTASPSISLGQVEDELREAEAYLFQEAPKKETLTDIALPTMTEARRKEIIAKLNSERAALRQRKTAPPSADDDRTSSTSFLDATAFFPLPSLHQHSFESPSQFNSIDDKRCGGDSRDGNDGAYSGDEDDGDDSMYFLKELERSDGNDSLFFASDIHNLPLPSFDPSSFPSELHEPHIPSPPTSPFAPAKPPCTSGRPPKRGVRFHIELEPPARSIAPSTATSDNPPHPTTRASVTPKRLISSSPSSSHPSPAHQSSSPPPPPPPPPLPSPKRAVMRSSCAKPPAPPSSTQQSKRMSQLARSVDYTAREKTKVAQDMATLTSTCSFRPAQSSRAAQTLKTPEKARRSKATAHSKPPPSWSPHKKAKVDELTERLHVEGALRFELREKVKQVLDDQRVRATCTFKPKINRNNRSVLGHTTNQKPIHTRLPELQRQKKEMLRQLEHAIEAESQLTFTPTINAHSHKLTHDMTKMDVTDRLVQDAEDTAEKKLQVQAYYAALDVPAFVPCVNERSNAIVEKKPEFKLDFVARQQLLHAQMEQKFEAKLALEERIQAEEKPFQPCIGNSNQVLQYTRPKRLVESTQAQLYRMTYEEPRQRALVKKRLEDEQYEKFSHKPTLNPVSNALGRPTSIHKLAQKAPTKMIRSRVVRDMDAQAQAECRFRPELVAVDDADLDRTTVWNPDTCLQQIEQARMTRRQKLEDQRNSLEFQELQACTFAPTINKSTTKPSRGPVVVRGLGRFLELKQLAKRQVAERKYVCCHRLLHVVFGM
ncbi:hypothetical protein, variant 1 [Aphanomyces astaci]|uniref:Uncharacterized protein n=1 Tax=Aphanomyces astaci TaxID=112090 RepID=W4FDV7_APHAT|nr:hypothetical protein, variant 1 [Aphanomyces astaci]ETV65677.1 hypothetical protein, variant 1 [Aphanomyces astaci]|eukprot:XP_009844840.1 hypothetical protein, variant 1 [Aphanomyces astaci]